MAINSRQDLIGYALKRLGFPVINIEVDPDQLEDRVDDAIQKYWDFHVDGTEQYYYISAPVTQEDIDNQYIVLPDEIVSVVRIFNFQNTIANKNNIFDLKYQLFLNSIWDMASASYVEYQSLMMHLRSIEILYTGEIPFTFTKNNNKLNIQFNWKGAEAGLGSKIVIECYRVIDPELNTKMYNDRWLKQYVTALFKKQWASNIQKFQNLQLPGGVQLNATYLMEQANSEIEKLEFEIETQYSAPLSFWTG